MTWAPHVKPLPRAVPHAALLALAREGHHVVLAHPPGYELEATVVGRARELATSAGGTVEVLHEQDAALRGSRVVYAKSWGSTAFYGDVDASAADLSKHRDWIVDEAAMARSDRGYFMHCLPVRRGVVAAAEVLDSPQSLVQEQALARLHVQKATLCRAMGVTP